MGHLILWEFFVLLFTLCGSVAEGVGCEFVMMTNDLFCFGIPVGKTCLVVVEVLVMGRTRLDGYFDDISLLNSLFELVKVRMGVFISILDGLDLVQVVLLKVTTHLFVTNYNKLLKAPKTDHSPQARLISSAKQARLPLAEILPSISYPLAVFRRKTACHNSEPGHSAYDYIIMNVEIITH